MYKMSWKHKWHWTIYFAYVIYIIINPWQNVSGKYWCTDTKEFDEVVKALIELFCSFATMRLYGNCMVIVWTILIPGIWNPYFLCLHHKQVAPSISYINQYHSHNRCKNSGDEEFWIRYNKNNGTGPHILITWLYIINTDKHCKTFLSFLKLRLLYLIGFKRSMFITVTIDYSQLTLSIVPPHCYQCMIFILFRHQDIFSSQIVLLWSPLRFCCCCCIAICCHFFLVRYVLTLC